MGDHLWTDRVQAGDIWNGRWTRNDLDSLITEACTVLVSPRDVNQALSWLNNLTSLLQNGPQTSYGIRRVELVSKEARQRFATVISFRRKRPITITWTLYDTCLLQYPRPHTPIRKCIPPPPPHPCGPAMDIPTASPSSNHHMGSMYIRE